MLSLLFDWCASSAPLHDILNCLTLLETVSNADSESCEEGKKGRWGESCEIFKNRPNWTLHVKLFGCMCIYWRRSPCLSFFSFTIFCIPWFHIIYIVIACIYSVVYRIERTRSVLVMIWNWETPPKKNQNKNASYGDLYWTCCSRSLTNILQNVLKHVTLSWLEKYTLYDPWWHLNDYLWPISGTVAVVHSASGAGDFLQEGHLRKFDTWLYSKQFSSTFGRKVDPITFLLPKDSMF